MLNLLSSYLAPTLLGLGFLLLVPGSFVSFAMRKKLSPRAKGHLWFWRSVGFWSLIIGGFMVLQKFLTD
jgi:hypothetical protein